MTTEWKNVSNFPPLWVGGIGEKIEGKLESVKDGQYGNSYYVRVMGDHMVTLFDAETKKPKEGPELVPDKKLIAMPSRAILVGKLDQVSIGDLVQIEAVGIVASKKKGFSDAVDYMVRSAKA